MYKAKKRKNLKNLTFKAKINKRVECNFSYYYIITSTQK